MQEEISLAKADAIRDGFTPGWVKIKDVESRTILAKLGFADAADVRRLADKFGRRR